MAKLSFLDFVRAQWTNLGPVYYVDLTGQTVVVTGANVGLGLEAAKHFARMKPAHLVLAVRNKGKGDVALAELRAETGYSGGKVMLLDQADFASVSAFATEFEKTHERLDVLVASAGIGSFKYQQGNHGYESTIQVNHLSTSLLTLRLLPLMKRTASEHGTHPTVTIVSSEVHHEVKLPKAVTDQPNVMKALSDPKTAIMGERYQTSKLFNLWFAQSLTSHLPPTSPLIINSVNPGLCYSSLRRDWPLLGLPIMKIMELLLCRTAVDGAKTYIWAALSGKNDVAVRENLRGAYTSACRIEEPSDYVMSQEGQKARDQVWKSTLEVLNEADPRLQSIIEQYLTT